jgi:predicted phosphodiesterase
MMIAVVGDCGGNANALQAALGAIADEGILTVFQTGNLAGMGGVDTVVGLLKEHRVAVCQGDLDRMLVRFEQKAASFRSKLDEETFSWLSATHGALSSAGLEYLRALHKRIDRSIENVRITVCHGSPSSQTETMDGETPHVRLQRHREAAQADLLVCGGAPAPFQRWADGALFVGPGHLVGAPGTARFVTVNTESQPWSVEVRSVLCAS